MSPDDPRHGTYAGVQAHWKAREAPCDECAAALARLRELVASLEDRPREEEA